LQSGAKDGTIAAWKRASSTQLHLLRGPKLLPAAMGAKATRYLNAGTRLVWIVYPRWRQVEVWRQGSIKPVRTLGVSDALDGEDVVPGFTYLVAALFS
jgi:hypothetical protein